jgi:hypothetical protein
MANFCGTIHERKLDILKELIGQAFGRTQEFSWEILGKKVKEYNQKAEPVGCEHFYELPEDGLELQELAKNALYRGLEEGSFLLVFVKYQ